MKPEQPDLQRELEARLAVIEQRLNRLEGLRAGPPPVWDIPPFLQSPTPYQPTDSRSLEASFGQRVLPIVGVGLAFLGIVSLVGLALQRGWITPAIQWAGELVLCGLLIGVGVRVRDERAPVGELLVGLGTAGLYLSLAGAHLEKQLLSGSGLLAGFVAISLLLLAYGWRRSSQALVAVAAAGGMAATFFPDPHDTSLRAALMALVFVPALGVAGGKRWAETSLAAWVFALVAGLGIVLDAPSDTIARPLVLFIPALAYLAVAGRLGEAPLWRVLPVPICAAFPVLSMRGPYVINGVPSAWWLTAFAAASALLAHAMKPNARNACLYGALSVAALIAPAGFEERLTSAWVYAGWVATIAIGAWVLPAGSLLLLSAFGLVGTLVDVETGARGPAMLGSAGVALALAAAGGRDEKGRGQYDDLAILLGGLALLLGVYKATDSTDELTANWVASSVWGALALTYTVAGLVFERMRLRIIGLFGLMVTAFKVVLIDLEGVDLAIRAILLLGLGLSMMALAAAYLRKKEPSAP